MEPQQKLPTSILLERTLELSRDNIGSDARRKAVNELLRRGDEETFETARQWFDSDDVTERELAANLLGQLGEIREVGGRQFFPFTDRSVPLLEKLMDDSEPRVNAAAIHSLAEHYLCGPVLARPMLADHPSKNVRLAVARAAWEGNDSEDAVILLIKLSEDDDDNVRDWASFGLGTANIDTPEIREALLKRLDDLHDDTKAEAMIGLARRKDARAIPHIKSALEADCVGSGAIEAAGHIGSPKLVGALEGLRSWWDVDTELLEAAIRSCKNKPLPGDKGQWVMEGEIVVPEWGKTRQNTDAST